jgi:hypothetical protein
MKVYGLAATHLPLYDQQELIRETQNKHLLLLEATNRLWAAQIQRLVLSQIYSSLEVLKSPIDQPCVVEAIGL